MLTLCCIFLALLVQSNLCDTDPQDENQSESCLKRFSSLSTRLSLLEERLVTMANELQKEKMKNKALAVTPKNRGARQVETVASTATLSHNLLHLGVKQVIKFDTVLTNEGNGYNPQTGHFTAPLPGLYLLSYNFVHFNSGETWLGLVVNGRLFVSGGAQSASNYQDLQAGNTVILRLNQNDIVWIENYYNSDADVRGPIGGVTPTTFTGYLLQ